MNFIVVAQKICRCGFNFSSKNDKTSRLPVRRGSKDLRTVHRPEYFDSKEFDKKKKKKKSCQELREERARLREKKKEELETVHLRLPPERAKQILDDINRRLISSSWRPPDLYPTPSTSYAHQDVCISHGLSSDELGEMLDADPLAMEDSSIDTHGTKNLAKHDTKQSEPSSTKPTSSYCKEIKSDIIQPMMPTKVTQNDQQADATEEVQRIESDEMTVETSSQELSHIKRCEANLDNQTECDEPNVVEYNKKPITLLTAEPVAELLKASAQS